MTSKDALACPLMPLHPLPLWTSDLRGIGGVIKQQLEDFEVEEIPAYEPCGEGQHLYLWIEKRDLSGGFLKRLLSRGLGVSDRDIGMAGLKDRRAITRQWVSVPAAAADKIDTLEDDRFTVLKRRLHGNKLRTGHLKGNRFVIRVREPSEDALERARAKLDKLAAHGMCNFYGSQRMGRGGSTLAAGWALAQGETRVANVAMTDETVHRINLRDRQLRRLAASALQSEVFNRVIARRMADGLMGRVLHGDVCRKTDTGGIFVTDDPAREQGRLDRREVDVTGPMWGPKMRRPDAAAADLEQAVLAETGLGESSFQRIGSLASGTRRALRVFPQDVSATAEDDAVVVRFSLPSGSFATVLLQELMAPRPELSCD